MSNLKLGLKLFCPIQKKKKCSDSEEIAYEHWLFLLKGVILAYSI